MDKKKKYSHNKNKVCAFYSETFTISISNSSEQVKEAVVIEGTSDKSPSIFLVFFDKKFYHISLKTKEILNTGEFTTQDSQNFKALNLNNKLFIAFTSQYQLHLLDLVENKILKNLFPMKIPGYQELKLSDEQKQALMQDGFMYEGFNDQNTIATCELIGVTNLPADEKNLFYSCIYNFNYPNENVLQYIFHIEVKSKQVVLCKLNDTNTYAVFENHRQFSKEASAQMIMHTYNVSKKRIEGYKKFKLPISDDTCVLSARYLDNEGKKLMIVGNDKGAPFLKIYSLSFDLDPKVSLLTDMVLDRPFDQLISRVLVANEKYIFYEVVQEGGVWLEFLEYDKRQIKYRKKLQYLKSSYQSEKEVEMKEDDFNELQKYSSDQVYVASLFAASEKTLVFLDDQDYENYFGEKPYQLVINYHRYTSLQNLLFHYMQQKELTYEYTQYEIKCCLDMLLQTES